jgi:tRNA (uracil-5-)-methyltransferase TRM9
MNETTETIETYDVVAEGWNNFRQRPYPEKWLGLLVERWKGGTLIDIGCGNARNMEPFNGKFKLTGVDASESMINKAKEFSGKKRINADFIVADARNIPVDSGSIDYALAIAVYHHFGSDELSIALKELGRILKPDGEALITVWNKLQPKYIFKGSDQRVSWKRRKDNKILYRYYHFYTPWVLKKIIEKTGFEIIMQGTEESFKKKLFSKNICFLVRKKRAGK